MKKTVKLFPDYCSSGVWLDGMNAEPEELGISPQLQFALKYWHEVWEFLLATDWDDEGTQLVNKMSPSYFSQWQEDGKILAKMLSAENETYEFVYVP